jgi:hypothetical protein
MAFFCKKVAGMRLGLLIAVGAGFTLTGCMTPYQSMGFLGGVSATQVNASTMRIVAEGNGYTSLFRIDAYARLKAAEETIAHGYDFFQIINTNDLSQVQNISFSPYTSKPVTKPKETLLIKMFKGPKPADASGDYLDARVVEQSIGAAVKRN